MTIDRLSSRWREESGQSAVLVAMLCGLLIFIIAMTTNIGKLVTEKIALQNAVDLAVYSGAAVQAGKMNEMRGHNDKIWQTLDNTRQFLQTSDPGPNPIFVDPSASGPQCNVRILAPGMKAPAGTAAITAAKGLITVEAGLLNIKNTTANVTALGAARDAADANFANTSGKLRPYHNMGPLMKLKRVRVDLSYRPMCFNQFGVPLASRWAQGETVDGWFFKDDKGEVAFVAGIVNAAPASPFMDSPQAYFAANGCSAPGSSKQGGRCGLSVYAAATPFYGKLGAGDGLGVFDESNQLRYNNVDFIDGSPSLSMLVDKKNLIGNYRPKSNKYQDYKVRFVGLNDRKANFVQAAGGQQIGNNAGTAGFRTKMRH